MISALALLSNHVRGAEQKDPACPGSPAWKHAKCIMKINFPGTECSAVQSEIKMRLTDQNWIDPHNQGTYKQNSASSSVIEGERLTGDGKYTDKFMFTFVTTEETDGGCDVSACSESQVTSILDFSTNFCNLRNLYCSTKDGCSIQKYDLEYKETYVDCWQNKVEKCFGQRIATE